jgi:transcriptional regulator with XRE-family HTH domain
VTLHKDEKFQYSPISGGNMRETTGTNFGMLQSLLIRHLQRRIHRGEVTERSLARVTGISQPHLHNVLKGKRLLSFEMADRILSHLGLDLRDLLETKELKED